MANTQLSAIRVAGIGTAGGIIAENIMRDQIDGIDSVAVNTDSQVLELSSANTKILLGSDIKDGFGATTVQCETLQESVSQIKAAIEGATTVFLIAGLGGETGTNATQLFAQIAQSLGIYTVAIVTMPFSSEGFYRMTVAKAAILNLRNIVNSLLVKPNDQICNPVGRGILDSYKAGDAVISGELSKTIHHLMFV